MSQCTVKHCFFFFFFNTEAFGVNKVIFLPCQVTRGWCRSPPALGREFQRGMSARARANFGSASAVPDSGHSHCHHGRFMLLCFLCSLQIFQGKKAFISSDIRQKLMSCVTQAYSAMIVLSKVPQLTLSTWTVLMCKEAQGLE